VKLAALGERGLERRTLRCCLVNKGVPRGENALQYAWFLSQYSENTPFASVSKRVPMQNLSHENEFGLHEGEHVRGNDFHMNGLAPIFV